MDVNQREKQEEISSKANMLITFIFVFSSVIMMCLRVCLFVCTLRSVCVQQQSFACKPVPASHLSVFILMPADSHQLSNSPTRD